MSVWFLSRFLLPLLLLVALGGCSKSPAEYVATDITGANYARDFHLVDQNGKPRSLTDFRGKVVAIFFGYTHCPDVCPTTLSDFAMALKKMGKDASRVQVIFVTVDPERDTPALLAQYVPAFNPGFLGMYTDEAGTFALAKEYKIFYQKFFNHRLPEITRSAGYNYCFHVAACYTNLHKTIVGNENQFPGE